MHTVQRLGSDRHALRTSKAGTSNLKGWHLPDAPSLVHGCAIAPFVPSRMSCTVAVASAQGGAARTCRPCAAGRSNPEAARWLHRLAPHVPRTLDTEHRSQHRLHNRFNTTWLRPGIHHGSPGQFALMQITAEAVEPCQHTSRIYDWTDS